MSATSKMPCRSVILQREDISAGGTSKTAQVTQKQSKKKHSTNIRFEIRLRLSDSFTWVLVLTIYWTRTCRFFLICSLVIPRKD